MLKRQVFEGASWCSDLLIGPMFVTSINPGYVKKYNNVPLLCLSWKTEILDPMI